MRAWRSAGRISIVCGLIACSEPPPPGVPLPDSGTHTAGGGSASTAGGHSSVAGGAGSAAGGGVSSTASDADGGAGALRTMLAWPFDGAMNEDWVLRNYVDLDPAADALRDYTGATESAKTYDGHNGVDISIATFREQDAGVVVVAAAAGEVTRVVDGFMDRNTTWYDGCGPEANQVEIAHADGTTARYLHFRNGSVQVELGQRVEAGDPLGLVGSSGCSTWPHLHLELRSADWQVIDPFLDGRFDVPPPYTSDAGMMAIVPRSTAYSDVSEVRDPAPGPGAWTAGQTGGVAIVLGAGRAGDQVEVVLEREDGSTFTTLSTTFAREYTRSIWWWNRTPDVAGAWTARVSIAGRALGSGTITVDPE